MIRGLNTGLKSPFENFRRLTEDLPAGRQATEAGVKKFSRGAFFGAGLSWTRKKSSRGPGQSPESVKRLNAE